MHPYFCLMDIRFKYISSLQNPLVRLCRSLGSAKERKESGLFLIEGLREVRHAQEGGYSFESLLFPASRMTEKEIIDFLDNTKIQADEYFLLDDKSFGRLAYREDTKNVLAIAHARNLHPDHLILPENPLILVMENIEKPGNIGAVLRTCDAAGVDAVLIAGNQTDLYNPNVIRASLGTVFTNRIGVCETRTAIDFLSSKGIEIFITTPAADKPYASASYRLPSAIVMGSEAYGVSDKWLKTNFHQILIPMYGKADSLNISVSAAIVLYEAVRQRKLV